MFQIDVNELPSKGVFYPVDYIEYKGLANPDVLKLSTAEKEFFEDVLTTIIIKSNIITNFNFDKLKVIDKDYILFKIREATFSSSEYMLNYTCPHESCRTHNNYPINYGENLEINYLEDDFEDVKVELSNNQTWTLRLPEVGDYKIHEELKSFYRGTYNTTAAIIATLVSSGTSTYEAYDSIVGKSINSNVNAMDIAKLTQYINMYDTYGICEYLQNVNCEECGGVVEKFPFFILFGQFFPTIHIS